jgi:hypothetical protein
LVVSCGSGWIAPLATVQTTQRAGFPITKPIDATAAFGKKSQYSFIRIAGADPYGLSIAAELHAPKRPKAPIPITTRCFDLRYGDMCSSTGHTRQKWRVSWLMEYVRCRCRFAYSTPGPARICEGAYRCLNPFKERFRKKGASHGNLVDD